MLAATYPAPQTGEYPAYFEMYLSQVPEPDPLAVMDAQVDEMQHFFGTVAAGRADHAYAPGKWTIKEVLGHLADTERVMSYRALSFARGSTAPLPGFDENAWMEPAGFGSRSLASLLDEWTVVRRASLLLFESLPVAARSARGVANNWPLSVSAIARMLPGHVRHHVAVVKERYL